MLMRGEPVDFSPYDETQKPLRMYGFVVELKIWRGPRYNEAGERQVAGYLEYFGLDVGYTLSFNFNKRKEPGFGRVAVGDKAVWEETV
jgi:hypothetical protein